MKNIEVSGNLQPIVLPRLIGGEPKLDLRHPPAIEILSYKDMCW